jgi:intracellular sulfur oxidation DsrE/DsrF family protein
MKLKLISTVASVAGAIFILASITPAQAGDGHHHGNNACPVGLVKGLSLDTEFGPGTSDKTKCLDTRHGVKLLVQINQAPPYALHTIQNVIDDYEITNGMKVGRDYQIAAIVHSAGGMTVVQDGTNGYSNPGDAQVRNLIAQGVKFYFCQNTTRGYMAKGILTDGNATAELIPGVQYVTAGISAIADFQSRGWEYVQP